VEGDPGLVGDRVLRVLPAGAGQPLGLWRVHRPAQLKVAQEIITLIVFAGFAWLWLGVQLRWNEAAAFALVLAAVVVVSLP
jgi:uncharacterized protein (DUF486 family)